MEIFPEISFVLFLAGFWVKKRNLSLTGLRQQQQHQGQWPAVDQVVRKQRDIVWSNPTKISTKCSGSTRLFLCYERTKRAGPVREGQWAGPIGTSLTFADRWTLDQLPTDGPT